MPIGITDFVLIILGVFVVCVCLFLFSNHKKYEKNGTLTPKKRKSKTSSNFAISLDSPKQKVTTTNNKKNENILIQSHAEAQELQMKNKGLPNDGWMIHWRENQKSNFPSVFPKQLDQDARFNTMFYDNDRVAKEKYKKHQRDLIDSLENDDYLFDSANSQYGGNLPTVWNSKKHRREELKSVDLERRREEKLGSIVSEDPFIDEYINNSLEIEAPFEQVNESNKKKYFDTLFQPLSTEPGSNPETDYFSMKNYYKDDPNDYEEYDDDRFYNPDSNQLFARHVKSTMNHAKKMESQPTWSFDLIAGIDDEQKQQMYEGNVVKRIKDKYTQRIK